jgi:transcription initiation factor TFIIIB Brf1 subunit/transcription initiation factor TFIIB
MIDVGSEWRTFGNESDSVDMTRVGAAQNLLYNTDNLETTTSFTAKRTVEETVQPKYGKKFSQVIFLFRRKEMFFF